MLSNASDTGKCNKTHKTRKEKTKQKRIEHFLWDRNVWEHMVVYDATLTQPFGYHKTAQGQIRLTYNVEPQTNTKHFGYWKVQVYG